MAINSKLSASLWFDGRALEAANFYKSVFHNSKVLSVAEIPTGPAEGNHVVEFELEGHKFTAFDAGPMFKFTPAISFVISCDSQEEIDHFWESLSDGGEKQQCGWVKDKFGISWQVLPAQLSELMEKDSENVMKALLQMKKLDLSKLRQAACL